MKTASEEVTDMIFLSKWSSQTVCAGAELGVFDCLSRDRTRTASGVAAEMRLDAALLYRLLRALASLGLLNETPGRRFSLTERGAVLRTDAKGRLFFRGVLPVAYPIPTDGPVGAMLRATRRHPWRPRRVNRVDAPAARPLAPGLRRRPVCRD